MDDIIQRCDACAGFFGNGVLALCLTARCGCPAPPPRKRIGVRVLGFPRRQPRARRAVALVDLQGDGTRSWCSLLRERESRTCRLGFTRSSARRSDVGGDAFGFFLLHLSVREVRVLLVWRRRR